uniref:ARAD1C03410p n=1 Tax=Blastobotrys adeninivorans TaxID=409370 RepID=A0A060SZU5_BLAAD
MEKIIRDQVQETATLGQRAREFVQYPVVASFIAGGVAGAVSRTVVSPLERAKIIFQVQGPGSQAYQGMVPTLVKMWKEEGWRGYMRGNGTNCIRIVPYSAVQFSSYTVYKKFLLGTSRKDLDTVERLSAGALAGITSVFATYPLDIVRTRLSIQTASIGSSSRASQARQHPPGMWSVMKNIYRTEGGIVALYRGIIPTTMGVAPYVGLNFAVYESMREFVTPEGQENPGAFGKLFSGAVSGAVAQTLTYPFDVLRRRFQVVSMGEGSLGFGYNSVWDALRKIVMQEGVRGLYKGLSANLLKVAPSMASSWLSYEFTKDMIAKL